MTFANEKQQIKNILSIIKTHPLPKIGQRKVPNNDISPNSTALIRYHWQSNELWPCQRVCGFKTCNMRIFHLEAAYPLTMSHSLRWSMKTFQNCTLGSDASFRSAILGKDYYIKFANPWSWSHHFIMRCKGADRFSVNRLRASVCKGRIFIFS